MSTDSNEKSRTPAVSAVSDLVIDDLSWRGIHRQCLQCLKLFLPSRQWQICCSELCSDRLRKSRQKEKALKKLTEEITGKVRCKHRHKGKYVKD